MGQLFSCTCSESPGERTTPYSYSQAKNLAEENSVERPSVNKATNATYEECWDLPTLLTGMTNNVSLEFARTFSRLIQEGNSLPFLIRYRKQDMQNLSPEKLQEIFDCYQSASEFRKRGITLLKSLEKSNTLTSDVREAIINTRTSSDLDLICTQLKSKEISAADHARSLGLEPVAVVAMSEEDFEISHFIRNHPELNTRDKLEQQLSYIISEIIFRDTRVLCYVKESTSITNFTIMSKRDQTASGKLTELDDKNKVPDVYKKYYNFESTSSRIKLLDVLTINRLENKNMVSVEVVVPYNFEKLERFCYEIWKKRMVVSKGIFEGFHRIIKPWLSQQVRLHLTSQAERESVKIFSKNLERLLLTEPLKNKIILGIDPGNYCCKIGIIKSNGKKCATRIIYRKHSDAESQLLKIISLHEVDVIALGDGQGCAETEQWLKRCTNVPVLAGVSEAGASDYSTKPEAREDDPFSESKLLSALSIARRVLDPLAEYVKMDPKTLGIGMYQKDMNSEILANATNDVVQKVVSLLGADLNTASKALLSRISGLNTSKAAAIVKYKEYHRFQCRTELLKVPGIDQATYQQCAGFLRIANGSNPLDNTIIHPECYDVAEKFLELLSIPVTYICSGNEDNLNEIKTKMASVNLAEVSEQLGTDIFKIQLIANVFKQEYQNDTSLKYIKPVYVSAIQNVSEIKEGMIIEGVVRNVNLSECYVYCGLGDSVKIPKSQIKSGLKPEVQNHVSLRVKKVLNLKPSQLELVEVLG